MDDFQRQILRDVAIFGKLVSPNDTSEFAIKFNIEAEIQKARECEGRADIIGAQLHRIIAHYLCVIYKTDVEDLDMPKKWMIPFSDNLDELVREFAGELLNTADLERAMVRYRIYLYETVGFINILSEVVRVFEKKDVALDEIDYENAFKELVHFWYNEIPDDLKDDMGSTRIRKMLDDQAPAQAVATAIVYETYNIINKYGLEVEFDFVNELTDSFTDVLGDQSKKFIDGLFDDDQTD